MSDSSWFCFAVLAQSLIRATCIYSFQCGCVCVCVCVCLFSHVPVSQHRDDNKLSVYNPLDSDSPSLYVSFVMFSNVLLFFCFRMTVHIFVSLGVSPP